MERIFTPRPKILQHICILQTWEVKLEDLKALTLYSPYKERAYIHGNLVSSISLNKHQASFSPSYVEFPSSLTFRVIGDHSITYLAFGRFLTSTLPMLSISSSPFIFQVPYSHNAFRQLTHWQFCVSSLKDTIMFTIISSIVDVTYCD